jgi:hypothetical protein
MRAEQQYQNLKLPTGAVGRTDERARLWSVLPDRPPELLAERWTPIIVRNSSARGSGRARSPTTYRSE